MAEPAATRDAPAVGTVGIFGGSFDPPHLGHAMASLWALATLPMDELWWVPTWRHAFGKVSAPYDVRVELCERAVRRLAGVRVVTIERELDQESRTIDTVEALRARYPALRFALVVGSDLVEDLPRWKRWDDLRAYPIHVVRRGSSVHGDGTIEIPDVSSTALRSALAAGDIERAARWMDRDVLAAVSALGLYRPGE